MSLSLATILSTMGILSGMGILFGLGLGYAGIKFKVEEDPRIPKVRDALPGANCGGCGFAGCDAFAAAVVEGKAKPSGCPVGGESCNIQVSRIMGVKPERLARRAAYIKCNGNCSKSVFRYDYYGMQDCAAATQLAGGGSKSCSYGCLGGGSCANICPFSAIDVVDGICRVNPDKCTACGRCVDACPRRLIELVPHAQYVRVGCSSRDAGKTVRSFCEAGCIGCKLCEKACKFDAVHVKDFLARIDDDKCTRCGECITKCPTTAIRKNRNTD